MAKRRVRGVYCRPGNRLDRSSGTALPDDSDRLRLPPAGPEVPHSPTGAVCAGHAMGALAFPDRRSHGPRLGAGRLCGARLHAICTAGVDEDDGEELEMTAT